MNDFDSIIDHLNIISEDFWTEECFAMDLDLCQIRPTNKRRMLNINI